MSESAKAAELSHKARRMVGRDPHDKHRVATSLELLFDLTFVVAFGIAGNEFAHLIAEGEVSRGLYGYVFAMFGVIWAWINFSWFASGFDCDDVPYRLTTMVQMVGVVILAIGLPPFFDSLHHGHVNNTVMVLGYIVMRVAMVIQWLRVARQDPRYRRQALTYVKAISLAQVGWVALAVAHTSMTFFTVFGLILVGVELGGPALAETRMGGTPWHAHHIAERYGLLAIIALGEGIIGTIAALTAAVPNGGGWDVEGVLVVVSGIGLTFGMWWSYFAVEVAPVLHLHRDRSFMFGYGHFPIYAGIAATGAGLHVAAYVIGHEAHISTTTAVAAVAGPVAVYLLSLFALFAYLMRSRDSLHVTLLAATAAVLVAALLLAQAGASMGWCLFVVMFAPWVTVVGYETLGHRHQAQALQRIEASAHGSGTSV